MLAVTILGNNSALAMHERHQTAQLVTFKEQYFLVDCGENTQGQLSRYKIKKSRINHIFISHLHGDHYYGLIGLLNTYSLNNRKDALHLYAVPVLKDIIELQLRSADAILAYDLVFHPISEAGTLFENSELDITCFPVSHRIPCWGFVFKEKTKTRKERDEKLRSYAYCADTRYDENILTYISGADLIYHESTYLDDNMEKAADRFHSTSSQAALIAVKANAKRLLLGHFSSKYVDLTPFETEAQRVFPAAEVSREGVTYLV
jgi:ribonuclease Z